MTSANTTGYIIFIKAAELICLFHPIYHGMAVYMISFCRHEMSGSMIFLY